MKNSESFQTRLVSLVVINVRLLMLIRMFGLTFSGILAVANSNLSHPLCPRNAHGKSVPLWKKKNGILLTS